MSDEEIRELERRWRSSGAPEDEEALIALRLRREGPTPRILGAALLGYDPLPGLLPDAPRLELPEEAEEIHQEFCRRGRISQSSAGKLGSSLFQQLQALTSLDGFLERLALAVGLSVLPRWQEASPDDTWGEAFVTAYGAWLASPTPERQEAMDALAPIDPGREELASRSGYARLDTLPDSLRWAYKEGYTRLSAPYTALSLGRSLAEPELEEAATPAERERFVGYVCRLPLGLWIGVAGPEVVRRSLREGLGPWLAETEDPLLRPRVLESTPEERARKQRRTDLRARLEAHDLGADRLRIAARCGDPVAKEVALEDPKGKPLRELPGTLQAPRDPTAILERPERDLLVRRWSVDCLRHAAAGSGLEKREPRLELAWRGLLANVSWGPASSADDVLDGLVAREADARSVLFRVGWCFAHMDHLEFDWARGDAVGVRGALMREASGAPLPAEPGDSAALEAEVERAEDRERDWQLRRLLQLLAAAGEGRPLEAWRPHPTPVLTILEGSGARARWLLEPDKIWKLGRQSACDVQLYSNRVSREHARLAANSEGTWWLENLSQHGSHFGGRKVEGRQRLSLGAPFWLADLCLTVELMSHAPG